MTYCETLKRMYYAQQEQGLPAGYRRVEYLESTGEQWIDTGVSPYGKELVTHVVFMPTTNQPNNNGIFGAYGDNDTRYNIFRGGFAYGQQGNCTVAIGTSQICYFYIGVKYDVWLNAIAKSASVNNDIYTGFNTSNGFANYNLYIFRRNNVATDRNAIMRLYVCDIQGYRHYVPCVRIADNKPGMYDLCGSICPPTNTPFYINSGTGADFTWGEL